MVTTKHGPKTHNKEAKSGVDKSRGLILNSVKKKISWVKNCTSRYVLGQLPVLFLVKSLLGLHFCNGYNLVLVMLELCQLF